MTAAAHPQLTGLPVLETARLVLRGPQAADWPVFRSYRSSARTAYTGGPKAPHQAAEQFASFFGHWVLRGFGRLIAEERSTGQPVGHFGPMQWADGGEVELTWSLWTAEAEGRGLATEGARVMNAWAFATLGLHHAIAAVHRDNAASHAIARGLGGTVIAGRKPEWFDDGAVYQFTGATT
jgi:[ribosomal protein S5]-alanine N-acetyltransferase